MKILKIIGAIVIFFFIVWLITTPTPSLIDAVKEIAAAAGCKRIWLITTNDNTAALRFYQKYGLALVAVHRNAVEASRRLKPEIPLTGNDGIPIRDEIELEMVL